MPESVIIALITSTVTLFGVILSNSKTAAVTTNEIKHLAEEVQIHHEAVSRSERYVPYCSHTLRVLTCLLHPAACWLITSTEQRIIILRRYIYYA